MKDKNMKLKPILAFAHSLLMDTVSFGDVVVDATVGNGHDTEFLASLVGEEGHVFGFDIQEKAITATTDHLERIGYKERVTLICKGHETVLEAIPKNYHGKITASIFNLGYLPGGDKDIVTHPYTTISAVQHLLEISTHGSLIILVIYHGHEGGEKERDEILTYLEKLDQKKVQVLQYQYINQVNNPPFVIAIEKR